MKRIERQLLSQIKCPIGKIFFKLGELVTFRYSHPVSTNYPYHLRDTTVNKDSRDSLFPEITRGESFVALTKLT